MRAPRQQGQAAAEYVPLLLVVVLAMAAAGAVASVPGVGASVAAAVRTGICIVGGDVCRTRDAEAAGLAPCVVRDREHGRDTTLELAVIRVGEDGRFRIATHSDGTVTVTRYEGKALGVVGGLGLELQPIGVELGVDGHLGVTRRSARVWRFETPAAAGAFLAALGRSPAPLLRPAAERWWSGGLETAGHAGISLPVAGEAGVHVGAHGALGRRLAGDRETFFYEGTFDRPQLYASLPGWASDATSRTGTVELTRDSAGPRELVIRMLAPTSGAVTELTARLDLRDPGIRAAAARALRGGHPFSPARLTDLAGLAATDGVVERHVHALDDRSETYGASAKLLVALGLEHTKVDIRRRLAAAQVWVKGAGPQRRVDCLGE